MFFLTKTLLGLPLVFLYWIGTPFSWRPESSMANVTQHRLVKEFREAKATHYVPRVAVAVLGVIVLLLYAIICMYFPSALTIIPFMVTVTLIVDLILLAGRTVHTKQFEEECNSTNLPVPENFWRDTSLTKLKIERNAAEAEAKASKADRVSSHYGQQF